MKTRCAQRWPDVAATRTDARPDAHPDVGARLRARLRATRLARSALLCSLSALLPSAARAQDDAALRQETGTLLARVVEKTTRPEAEESELELSRSVDGNPFERSARVEVAWRRAEGEEALRVRFREPPSLRDHAWLQVWRGEQTTCWRWTPARPRPERVTPLPGTWRLAGSGLVLDDLRGERAGAWTWTLLGDAQREGLRLHLLQATPRAGEAGHPGAVVRLLRVDAERRLPLEAEWRDAGGAWLKRARLSDWRALAGKLRPFALELVEPGQTTRVKVTSRRSEPPAPRFDPDAFFR